MPTNLVKTASGSTGEGVDKVEFSVEFNGYSNDQAGLDQITKDYGLDVVGLINKARSTLAVNTERARLTKDDKKVVKENSNAFEEIKNASSEEEKQALVAKYFPS